MTNNLTQSVRESFGLAAMSRKAKLKLSAPQWKQYQKISNGFENKRLMLKADYSREYTTRVEAARKRLIDKGAAKTKDYKHRLFGYDLFDGKAITRQAQREVRFEHEQDLRQLNSQEHQTKEVFLERFKNSEQQRGRAAKEFESKTNQPVTRDRQKTR